MQTNIIFLLKYWLLIIDKIAVKLLLVSFCSISFICCVNSFWISSETIFTAIKAGPWISCMPGKINFSTMEILYYVLQWEREKKKRNANCIDVL